MSFSWKIPFVRSLAVVIATVASLASPLTAQVNREAVERLTVMIEAAGLQGGQGGAGIIVGHDAGAIYVATAKHTIQSGDQLSDKISVSVRWSPSTPLYVRKVDIHPKLDLALLTVNLAADSIGPDALLFSSMGAAARMKRNADLNVLGWPQYPNQPWEWCPASFSFDELIDGNIKFARGCFNLGHSGGPVVDKAYNIVGMAVGFSSDEVFTYSRGSAYSLEKVRDAVREIDPSIPFTLSLDGPETSRPIFTQVQVIASPTGPDGNACALTDKGQVYCWGPDTEEWSNIEEKTLVSSLYSRCIDCKPTYVATHLRFTSLAVSTRLCGLSLEHRAYCWSSKDGFVPYLPDMRFTSLSESSSHSCGITLQSDLYCWGNNDYGQLGDGTTTASLGKPVLVQGGMKWVQIDVAFGFSCGIAQQTGMPTPRSDEKSSTTGKAYCWGKGDQGALGGGSLTNSAAPVAVAYDPGFSRLSVGKENPRDNQHLKQFACGIDANGQGTCWGRGASPGWFKQPSSPPLAPRPIDWDGALLDLASGEDDACAISSDAKLVCWGQSKPSRIQGPHLSRWRPGWSLVDPPELVLSPVSYSRIGDGASYAFTASGDLYAAKEEKHGLGRMQRAGLPVLVSQCGGQSSTRYRRSLLFEDPLIDDKNVPARDFKSFTYMDLSQADLDALDGAHQRATSVLNVLDLLTENCRLDDAMMVAANGFVADLQLLQTQIGRWTNDSLGHDPHIPAGVGWNYPPPAPPPKRGQQSAAPKFANPETYALQAKLRTLIHDYESKSIALTKWAKEVARLWER
jgi:hypothetical protein